MGRATKFCALALLANAVSFEAVAQITFHEAVIKFDVRADGSAVQESHLAIEASTDSAAQRLAQQPLVYSSSREELTIVEAYTQKADGTRYQVDPSAVHSELVPGSSQYPLFNDLSRKVIIFPAVAARDLIVFTVRREIRHPLFGGQFIWQAFLNRTSSWQNYSVTITSPAALPLHIEPHGMALEIQQNGDITVYRIQARYAVSLASDSAAVGPYQRLPRLFVSSLPDYSAMAHAYATLAIPKEVVTPEIQRLADQLTEGISDRREQARVIYDWVSTHIRYVAIWLGQGAVEPHAASAVLQVGYGDCKDHAVLFSTLLKAVGITSEPVLINFGNEYVLPGPPTMGVLNHVITWLPEFSIYADTTAGVAPFGVLPFQEYGKPVVHVVSLPSERRTPRLAPGAAVTSLSTQAELATDGTISGESKNSRIGTILDFPQTSREKH